MQRVEGVHGSSRLLKVLIHDAEYGGGGDDDTLLSFSVDEEEHERLVRLMSSPKNVPAPIACVDPEEYKEAEEEATTRTSSGRRVKQRTWDPRLVGRRG